MRPAQQQRPLLDAEFVDAEFHRSPLRQSYISHLAVLRHQSYSNSRASESGHDFRLWHEAAEPDVCQAVAIGGRPDMMRTAQFGRE
jgi:hypothetical protein